MFPSKLPQASHLLMFADGSWVSSWLAVSSLTHMPRAVTKLVSLRIHLVFGFGFRLITPQAITRPEAFHTQVSPVHFP